MKILARNQPKKLRKSYIGRLERGRRDCLRRVVGLISLDDHTTDNALESISAWKGIGRRDGLETRDPRDVGFPVPSLAPHLHLLAGRAARRI